MNSELPRWQPFLAGTGQVQASSDGWRLSVPQATRQRYADAQLDDYGSTRSFLHAPPLRFSVRARFSATDIVGTAGFGFWNQPFAPGSGWPRLPRALWFFYGSPPNDLRLALNVPGHGWKAACLDATQPAALALAPLALPVVLLNRSRRLYQRLWPWVQRGLRITEAALSLDWLPDWHTYEIDWKIDRAELSVDGRVVLRTDRPPRGRMGLVIWLDNQYAVVTPTGTVSFGLLDVKRPQWLEINDPRCEQGSDLLADIHR